MKPWRYYLICAATGVAAGIVLAVSQVRSGLSDEMMRNGPWTTGKSFGSNSADALTRAMVALRGLLALPVKEAMYFTASVDTAGRQLEGRCTYTLTGGELPARWWSITLYDPKGYLVANRQGLYSIGSGSILMNESMPPRWLAIVGPNTADDGHNSIPTGEVNNFELTLRVYHPSKSLIASPQTVTLPEIRRGACKR